ncbi:MAG: RimK family alpha-L-glutamate ligase [Planctomycetota bacterium]
MEQPPRTGPLILSRNVAIYSTRRLTEAFRARGRPAHVLDPAAVGLLLRESALTCSESERPLAPPAVLVPRIGAAVTAHGLSVIRQMELLGVPTTAGSAAIRLARDKMESLQVLAAKGLPVPPTALVRETPDADWAVAAVGGPPVVLKFLSGTHGTGVFLAESLDAARTILEAMWGIEKNLLVQGYIETAAGRDLRLFVIGDEVVASIRRTAPPGSFKANLHQGGRATAVTPDDATVELALAAAKAIGLHVAGVDLLTGDDGPLVTEVNASPGLEGVEDATGKDVAGAVVDAAIRLADGRGNP